MLFGVGDTTYAYFRGSAGQTVKPAGWVGHEATCSINLGTGAGVS